MLKDPPLDRIVAMLDDRELEMAFNAAVNGDFHAVELRLSRMRERGVVEDQAPSLRGVAIRHDYTKGKKASPWGKNTPIDKQIDVVLEAPLVPVIEKVEEDD